MKRCSQDLCRRVVRVTGPVNNADGSMFLLPADHTEFRLYADTALSPGALALCADKTWQSKGFVLHTAIAAPTACGRANS